MENKSVISYLFETINMDSDEDWDYYLYLAFDENDYIIKVNQLAVIIYFNYFEENMEPKEQDDAPYYNLELETKKIFLI